MSSDIHPNDLDPDTGRPYAGYSSPALDTAFHDGEMAVDDAPASIVDKALIAYADQLQRRIVQVRAQIANRRRQGFGPMPSQSKHLAEARADLAAVQAELEGRS
jgi:hypothetical protein